MVIYFIYAFCSGITIVISRYINGLLSRKHSNNISLFYNYLTGSLGSLLLILFFKQMTFQNLVHMTSHFYLLLGGIIGVLNIYLSNIISKHLSPVKITLFIFISQNILGFILDCLFFNFFSIKKLMGCFLAISGLYIFLKTDVTKI